MPITCNGKEKNVEINNLLRERIEPIFNMFKGSIKQIYPTE